MTSDLTKLVDPGATYLVTGGAGFIGSHLVEHLLHGGARVRVLDDFSTGRRENLAPFLRQSGRRENLAPFAKRFGKNDIADVSAGTSQDLSNVSAETSEGAAETSEGASEKPEVSQESSEASLGGDSRFELLEGTITELDTCRKAMKGVDVVFHQAALPSVPRSVKDPISSHEVNATGTLNVLMAAKEAGVRRVVYASSSSAYGDTPTLPKIETQPQSPRSPYAVAKLAGEQYCRAFAAVFGLETVALRYFNVFGPRQDPDSPYAAVIPLFASAAMEGRSPTIDGDGGQTRDFTYIENVVLANFLAASVPGERVSGEVFNVGCGDRISINDLWNAVRAAIGTEVDAIHGPPRPGDVRDSLASLAHLTDRTGYVVRVGLEEGIERTVAWIRGGA